MGHLQRLGVSGISLLIFFLVCRRLTGGPSPSLSPSAPLSDLERVLAQARSRARDRTPDPPARSPGRPPSPSASQSRGSLGRVSSFRSPPGARLQPQRAQSVRLRASAKEEGEAPPSPQRGPLDRRAQEELVSMFLALESDVKGLRAALRRAADLLESSGAPPPDVQSIRAVIGAPAGGAEDPEVTRLRSQLASAQAELAHVKRQRDALLLCEMQSDAPPATLERTDTVVTIAAGAAPAHGGEGGARSVTPGDSEAAGGDGGPGKGQAEAAGSITAVGKPTSPDRQTAGSLTPSPVGRMGSLAFPTVSGEEVRVMDNPLWGASNPGTPSVADGCDGAGVTSGRVAQGRVGGDGVLDVDVEELEVPELEASDADSDRFDPGEHEAFMGMLEKQMEVRRSL